MKAFFNSQTSSKERAQAIVEFAIVLPILMVILVGILEAGRMVFIYAAVNNASREAARYASAYGLNDAPSPVEKYRDCPGIKAVATRASFLITPSAITIYHDDGVTNANPPVPIGQVSYCSGASDSYKPDSGDRVTVEVTATYKPMVKLIPFQQRSFTSKSSRTVLGVLELTYP